MIRSTTVPRLNNSFPLSMRREEVRSETRPFEVVLVANEVGLNEGATD